MMMFVVAGRMGSFPWLFALPSWLVCVATLASSSASSVQVPGCLARVFVDAGIPPSKALVYEKALFGVGVQADLVTQKSKSITFYLLLFANMHKSHLKMVDELCNSAGGCQPCDYNGRCRLNSALSAAGGEVSEEQRHYMCSCPGSVDHAVQCPTPDKCRSKPCLNGGTCSKLQQVPFFSCSCPALFFGMNCQNELDPCDPDPCENAGTCRKVAAHPYYSCSCSMAFYGKNCQREHAPCQSTPCMNGATCRQDARNARKALCMCAPGFTGPLCDSVWLTEDHWNSVVSRKDDVVMQLNERFLAELSENTLLLAESRNATMEYVELQAQAMNLSAHILSIQEETRVIQTALHSKTKSLLAQSESILTAASVLSARLALVYKLYAGGNWSWMQAASRCRQLGGELASIRTGRQQQRVLSINGIKHGMSGVWLGARDMSANKDNADYLWMNGDPILYTNWAPVESRATNTSDADIPGQRCVLMSFEVTSYIESRSRAGPGTTGIWKTDKCDSESYGYVCEFVGGL